MVMRDIRGKRANEIRWEALRRLDWNKDAEVIEYIFQVKNGQFFSSSTPEQVIEQSRENIEFKKMIAKANMEEKEVC